MYEYNASLIRVIDGDTAILRVDLGFKMYCEMSFRLLGINAPELNSTGGAAAKDHLFQLLTALGPTLRIQTTKPDKYGRWLVTFPRPYDATTVNQQMIEDGQAVAYNP